VMFEHVFPRHGHAVWSAAGVKLVVWSRGPSNVRLPVGWTLHSLTVQHSELGGVTDGVFHVRVARRVEVEFQPPREFVGVSATLLQIMDPTVGGRTCPEGEPTDGATNTAKGLLNWNQRRGSVAAPSVFPGTPWVTRKLTDSEFLAALDVPATRAKTADVPTAQLWGRELRIPFKVRLEVCATGFAVWPGPEAENACRQREINGKPSGPRPCVQATQHHQQGGRQVPPTPRFSMTFNWPTENTMMPKFRFTFGMIVRGKTRI